MKSKINSYLWCGIYFHNSSFVLIVLSDLFLHAEWTQWNEAVLIIALVKKKSKHTLGTHIQIFTITVITHSPMHLLHLIPHNCSMHFTSTSDQQKQTFLPIDFLCSSTSTWSSWYKLQTFLPHLTFLLSYSDNNSKKPLIVLG